MDAKIIFLAVLLPIAWGTESPESNPGRYYWSSWRTYWNAYWNRNNKEKTSTNVQDNHQVTSQHEHSLDLSGLRRCNGTMDCLSVNISFVCVGATVGKEGYCLPSLKPMEYGCKLDEQCAKACPTSYCSDEPRFKNQKGDKQCRCKDAHYYLFKKCWKRCMPTTEPITDADGTLRCQPKNPQISQLYLRRNKRQIRSARIIC